MKPFPIGRLLATLAAPLLVAFSADAAPAAYGQTQSAADAALNGHYGLLANTSGPITFDFVVPYALGPSQSYTFGYKAVSPWPNRTYSGPLQHSAVQLIPALQGGVAEPAAWAMMIGGMSLTGGVLRRRRYATTLQ